MHYKSECYILTGRSGAANARYSPHPCTWKEAQWLPQSIRQKFVKRRAQNAAKSCLRRWTSFISARPQSFFHGVKPAILLIIVAAKKSGAKLIPIKTVKTSEQVEKDMQHVQEKPLGRDADGFLLVTMDCDNVQPVMASFQKRLTIFMSIKRGVEDSLQHAKHALARRNVYSTLPILTCHLSAMMGCVNVQDAMPCSLNIGNFLRHIKNQSEAYEGDAENVIEPKKSNGMHKTSLVFKSINNADIPDIKALLLLLRQTIGSLLWLIGIMPVRSAEQRKDFGGNYKPTIGFLSLRQDVLGPFQPISSHSVVE
jgi:hypothetical protein